MDVGCPEALEQMRRLWVWKKNNLPLSASSVPLMQHWLREHLLLPAPGWLREGLGRQDPSCSLARHENQSLHGRFAPDVRGAPSLVSRTGCLGHLLQRQRAGMEAGGAKASLGNAERLRGQGSPPVHKKETRSQQTGFNGKHTLK